VTYPYTDTKLRSYPLRQVITTETQCHSILNKIFTNISEWFYHQPYCYKIWSWCCSAKAYKC